MTNTTADNNNNNTIIDISALNKDGRELDSVFNIRKKMATARSIDNTYRLEGGVEV